MQSVSTKQVNAQNWRNDRLCGLNLDDFRPDSIAIYTTLQLALPDEFSDVTYTISGGALADNEANLLLHASLLLVFCDISDNEQISQAAHLHRCIDELGVDSLAMILVPHSSTSNEIRFEAYEKAIHTGFDVIVGEPKGRRLACEVQSKVISIRSQAQTLNKAWTERIDNANDAKMIKQYVDHIIKDHLRCRLHYPTLQ